MKLIAISTFIVILSLSPVDIWGRPLKLLKTLLIRIKDLLRPDTMARRGQQLVDFCQSLMAYHGPVNLKRLNEEPVEYKYYSKIISMLIRGAKLYGFSMTSPLTELLKNLIKDLEFEKKVRQLYLGSLAQFFLISATTVIFYTFIDYSVMSLGVAFYIKILGVQLMGLAIFQFGFSHFRNSFFLSYDKVFFTLFTFKSLNSMPVETKKMIEISKADELSGIKDKELKHLKNQILNSLESWRKQGGGLTSQVDQYVELTQLALMNKYEKFIQMTSIIKFATLSVFFLGSYLFGLLSLSKLFLIE